MCKNVNGIVTHPPFCIICCQAYLAHMNHAHSMQGRLDQILSTISERIQMQVSTHHPAFGTLCSLLLHEVGLLEHVVVHLTRAEESVALWTQSNKLLHRHRIHFVLEASDCLVIHNAIEGVVEVALTGITVSRCIGQTIRVRELQSQLASRGYFTHM